MVKYGRATGNHPAAWWVREVRMARIDEIPDVEWTLTPEPVVIPLGVPEGAPVEVPTEVPELVPVGVPS